MDKDQTTKRTKRASRTSTTNGADGGATVAREPNPITTTRRWTWEEVVQIARRLELTHPEKRIARILCTCEAPNLYNGVYGNAFVLKGEPASIIWSDGQKQPL